MKTLLATSLLDIIRGIGPGSCGTIPDFRSTPGNENTIWIALCNLFSVGFYWVMAIAGIAALATIIYGGYLLLTSGGDTSRIEQGKKFILWALIGIVIVGLARLAVGLIVQLINPTTPVPPGLT